MTSRVSISLREALVQGSILLLLLAAAFPGVFFRGEVAFPSDILYECNPWKEHAPAGWQRSQNYLMSDPVSAFMPSYYVANRALDSGEWPLWNPYELAGMPLLANCQSAVFYPPRLLFRIFSFPMAITAAVLLKLWLAGMAAYACGRGLRLNAVASRLFSVAWMLSGYVFIWAYWPVSDAAVWFPVMFLGVEWALAGRYRRAFWTTAVVGTLMFLAGHPESAFVLNACLFLYLLVRVLSGPIARLFPSIRRRVWPAGVSTPGDTRRLWKPVVAWLGGWTLALLLCAPQLLPFLEYVLNASPPGTGAQGNFGPHPGLPARALASLWAPLFFGTVVDRNYWGELDMNRFVMAYTGVSAWIVAALLGARPVMDGRTRARTIGLAVIVAVCLLLAFEVPPFAAFHRLPGFSLVKRTYYVGFAVFALPLLGATVLQAWLAGRPRWRDLGWCAGAFAGIHAVIWIIYRFFGALMRALKMDAYVGHQWIDCALLGGAALLILALAIRVKRPRLVMTLLTFLLAADLLMAWQGINATTPRGLWYPDTPLTRYLQALPGPCRIGLLEGMVPPGFMTPYGIQDISSYDGIYPERMVRFQRTLKTDVWKAIEPIYNNTHYLVNPQALRFNPMAESPIPVHEPGHFVLAATLDGLEVYENNRALPRAFLVGGARVVPDVDALFRILRGAEFDPRREVLLEEPPPVALPATPSGDVGTASIAHYGTTRVAITTDAPEPRMLILADAYYPGWSATVDGHPAPIQSAYYAFRAVGVPAGRHAVVFRYFPASFCIGLMVSLCTMAATLVYTWRRLRIISRHVV